MISEQEFLEIVHGLMQKTATGNVKWQPKSLTFLNERGQTVVPPAAIRDAYWVQLPHSVIELQYGNPSNEPDFINFILARQLNGPPLALRKVYEADVGWQELSNLYALVKRRDLGWDDVLNDVRNFLGMTGSPTSPSAASTID